MLNSKQRARLRSYASTIDATTIIGKDGLTENVLAQIDRELLARELNVEINEITKFGGNSNILYERTK